MGAALRLPVFAPDDLMGTIGRLRADHGLRDDRRRRPARRRAAAIAPGPDRLALLLGSEAFGLDDAWLGLADRRVTIPMRPGADSLNVAVAAGIFLHHFTRADPG